MNITLQIRYQGKQSIYFKDTILIQNVFWGWGEILFDTTLKATSWGKKKKQITSLSHNIFH